MKVWGCNVEKICLIPKGLGNPTCLVNESEDGWTQMYDVWVNVRALRGLWGGVPWGLGTNPWLTPSTKLLSPHSWKTFQWVSLSILCIPPLFHSFPLKIATVEERKNFERCDLLSALYGSLSAQLTGIESATQMKYFSIIDQSSYIFFHFLSERYTLRWYLISNNPNAQPGNTYQGKSL